VIGECHLITSELPRHEFGILSLVFTVDSSVLGHTRWGVGEKLSRRLHDGPQVTRQKRRRINATRRNNKITPIRLETVPLPDHSRVDGPDQIIEAGAARRRRGHYTNAHEHPNRLGCNPHVHVSMNLSACDPRDASRPRKCIQARQNRLGKKQRCLYIFTGKASAMRVNNLHRNRPRLRQGKDIAASPTYRRRIRPRCAEEESEHVWSLHDL